MFHLPMTVSVGTEMAINCRLSCMFCCGQMVALFKNESGTNTANYKRRFRVNRGLSRILFEGIAIAALSLEKINRWAFEVRSG